ncbi:hypothetical protein HTZ77_05750 [Nonomuraea sp. SMC257]|uniref:Uncharacterized protein n=1 Tax=Nonomuraea montanisoli TaxID=2741721 RepID=A0A7Y6I3A9_9ACTN|nr:hypothetical protein [Nonomuraea montanisoli]NUW30922.1 hypothetical protein [Nonomuraea montanisoli]
MLVIDVGAATGAAALDEAADSLSGRQWVITDILKALKGPPGKLESFVYVEVNQGLL